MTDKLLETLQELPFVHIGPLTWESRNTVPDVGIDADLSLNVAGKDLRLLVEVKKSVYPRDVRQMLWQLKHISLSDRLNGADNAAVPLIAAESLSPGAKSLLKEERVGYYDTGGSLFIPAQGAYFYIDKPPPKTIAKTIRSLFRGKRSQVLHAILLNPEKPFGVKSLAHLAKVSAATVSETLTALERFDWLSSKGQGPSKERRLVDPSALLNEWSNQILGARSLPHRRYYVPSVDPDTLVEKIDQFCEVHRVEYVLTQETAAQRYAPFLSTISQVKCRTAPGRAVEEAVGELGARVVNEGANLIIFETKSQGEFLFKERFRNAWLASPVQVYLDLLCAGGRAKEMAEHLRRERIRF